MKKKERLTCQLLSVADDKWFQQWENELNNSSSHKHPQDGEYEIFKSKMESKNDEDFITTISNF